MTDAQYEIKLKLFLFYMIMAFIGIFIDSMYLPAYLTYYTTSVIILFLLIGIVGGVFCIEMLKMDPRDEAYLQKAELEETQKQNEEPYNGSFEPNHKNNPYRRFRSLQMKRKQRSKKTNTDKKRTFDSPFSQFILGFALSWGIFNLTVQTPNYLFRSSQERCVRAEITDVTDYSRAVSMDIRVGDRTFALNHSLSHSKNGVFTLKEKTHLDLILQKGYFNHYFIMKYGQNLCTSKEKEMYR